MYWPSNGKRTVSNGTSRVWDVWAAGGAKELCKFVTFRDGTWAVMDSPGRYDSANGGDIPHLHCVVGLQTMPLDEYNARYFDPGLLGTYMADSKNADRSMDARRGRN
jgi:hypothetical protein